MPDFVPLTKGESVVLKYIRSSGLELCERIERNNAIGRIDVKLLRMLMDRIAMRENIENRIRSRIRLPANASMLIFDSDACIETEVTA